MAAAASAKMTKTWKYHSAEKFDEYMKAVGVGLATRTAGSLAKPTLKLEVDEKNFYYKSESTFKTLELRCKIGEEFDEETPDGRKTKTKFHWEGDKLHQVQNWNGKTTSVIRYVDDNGDLINDCVMGDIVCRRVYKPK